MLQKLKMLQLLQLILTANVREQTAEYSQNSSNSSDSLCILGDASAVSADGPARLAAAIMMGRAAAMVAAKVVFSRPLTVISPIQNKTIICCC